MLKDLVKFILPNSITNYIRTIKKQIINFKILSIKYGQFETIKRWSCIDKNGNPIPWFTYPCIEYLNHLDLSECVVFEYGSGYSTLYWLSKARKVISVEHDENWYREINYKIKGKINKDKLTYYLLKNENDYISAINKINQFIDVIVIDGRWRRKCAESVAKHIKSFGGGMLIFDNSDWYPNTIKFLRNELNWIEIDFIGFSPINNYTLCTSIFFNPTYRFTYKENLKPIGGIVQISEEDSV